MVTIGTDSLTSNWQLSIWEEIKTIKKYQSFVTLETLLTWATINGAKALGYDARKNERLKRHECKACFYASRIGGAAMTTRPCMSCGSEEMYGSTATDVLCMDCATKHGLCKHCGGDLEMRTRRKDWPETPNA